MARSKRVLVVEEPFVLGIAFGNGTKINGELVIQDGKIDLENNLNQSNLPESLTLKQLTKITEPLAIAFNALKEVNNVIYGVQQTEAKAKRKYNRKPKEEKPAKVKKSVKKEKAEKKRSAKKPQDQKKADPPTESTGKKAASPENED